MSTLEKEKILPLYMILPIGIVLIFLAFPMSVAAAIYITLIFYLIFIYLLKSKDQFFRKMFLISFFLRFLMIALDEILLFLPTQSDSFIYHNQAVDLCLSSPHSFLYKYEIIIVAHQLLYSKFLSCLYTIFGCYPIVGRLFNSYIFLFAAILLYEIVNKIFENKRTAAYSIAWIVLMPSCLVFSSYLLRDSLLFFLSVLILLFFVNVIQKRYQTISFIILMSAFFYNGLLRVQNYYLFGLIFLLFFVFQILTSVNYKKYLYIVLVILVATVIFVAKYPSFSYYVITYPLRAQPLRAEGGSAYLSHLVYNDWYDVLLFLPIRFIYFTFGPFIWNIGGAFQLFTALEGLVILLAAIWTVIYFTKYRIEHNFDLQIFLLIFCLIGLLANASVDSNFGTAVRHRMNYVVFFFIFAKAALEEKRLKREK